MRRSSTPVAGFVKGKLQRFCGTPATKHGQNSESSAVEAYERRFPDRVVSVCGMFVDPDDPWLAATPDMLVLDAGHLGCLEVKCPLAFVDITIEEAAATKAKFCLKLVDGFLALKENHEYYYQVQIQMHVTHREFADFVVWSPCSDLYVTRVFYHRAFAEAAVAKMKEFYFRKFLPALLCLFLTPEARTAPTVLDAVDVAHGDSCGISLLTQKQDQLALKQQPCPQQQQQ